jgi:hypothetical protein
MRAATVGAMRQRWRAWAAAGVAVVVVGAVPLVLDRDSFPLSTFPMFAADIDRTQSIDTAVAIGTDGSIERLSPADIGGTTVVNQAASVVTTAIVGGRADELCAAIAKRVAGAGADRVAVEVVTERYDAVRWFDGERTPVERVVHARCPVAP